jgi:hypothetical protein
MGYFGLESWACSDGAADDRANMLQCMAESLEKSIKDKGNCYNTPGCVNVALILEDKAMFGKMEPQDRADFAPVAKKARKQILLLIEAICEDLAEPDCDLEVRRRMDYHYNNFKRMVVSLDKFLKGTEEWE